MVLGVLIMPSAGCQPVQAVFTPESKVMTREATVAAESVEVEGELPEGLPGNVPLWPGATVADFVVDEDDSVTLVMQTPDNYDAVLGGLGVGLERSGWQAVQTLQEESASSLEITNAEYEGILTVTAGEAGTIIEYFLLPNGQ
jgi:hypothetical protein